MCYFSFFFFKYKTEFLARQNCNFGWGATNSHYKINVLAVAWEPPLALPGPSQLSGFFSASLEWIMYMKVCSMVKSGGRLPLCTPTCLLMRLRVEL